MFQYLFPNHVGHLNFAFSAKLVPKLEILPKFGPSFWHTGWKKRK